MNRKLSAVAAVAFSSLFALGVTPAKAGNHEPAEGEKRVNESETYLTFTLGSYHFGKHEHGGDFNNFNPGVGIEHVGPFRGDGDGGVRLGVTGGVYYDSVRRISVYAGGMAEACTSPRRAFMLCSGGTLGVVTNEHGMTVAPLVEPFGKVEHSSTGIFVKASVVPPLREPVGVIMEAGFRF